MPTELELPSAEYAIFYSKKNQEESLDRDTKSETRTSVKEQELSNIFGASVNLANSIIGGCVIGIPFAFRETGLIAGLILLLCVSILTDLSLRIIIGLASYHPQLRNANVKSYEDLASYPFGKIGERFIMFFMLVS